MGMGGTEGAVADTKGEEVHMEGYYRQILCVWG